MNLSLASAEIWMELRYSFKGKDLQYNLLLASGEKFLDGLKVVYERDHIHGGCRYSVVLEPLGTARLKSFRLTGSMDYHKDLRSLFVNGYQSWTGSRERFPGEKISRLNWPGYMLRLADRGDYTFCEYSEKKGQFHGYSYAYLRYSDRLVLAASLDESAGFTVFGVDLKQRTFTVDKDLDGMEIDLSRSILEAILIEGSEEEVFDRWAELRRTSRTHSQIHPFSRPATGWCSPPQPEELQLHRRLEDCVNRRIPLDFFSVGPGWQRVLGDWDLPSVRFPSGMAELAREIRKCGYTPGIWFAPFVVGADSVMLSDRRDWLRRDSSGKLKSAGFFPSHGGCLYALNTALPEVRRHIIDTVARFRDEWGFGFIHADLLYTAALLHPKGRSRGEAMDAAMDILSEAKGSTVYTLGAVPMEAAFNRGEFCRVGAESRPFWENYAGRGIHYRERSSTLNGLRSLTGRRHLSGRFFSSDPGTFFLGDRRRAMEPHRRCTQMRMQAVLAGLLTNTDSISALTPPQEQQLLSLFPRVAPQIDDVSESRRTVTIRFRVEQRHYAAFFNLSEGIRKYSLPEGRWFAAPSPERPARFLIGGVPGSFKPGESGILLLLDDTDNFAGGDGHIFPGFEIAAIAGSGNHWTVTPKDGILRNFRIWLRCGANAPVFVNGKPARTIPVPWDGTVAEALISVLGESRASQPEEN